jgi:hypothetical protein
MGPENKVVPIRQASLFESEKPEPSDTASMEDSAPIERPYGEKNLLLGASAFTANGWAGSFYPAGTNPGKYLTYYSTKFQTDPRLVPGERANRTPSLPQLIAGPNESQISRNDLTLHTYSKLRVSEGSSLTNRKVA